MKEYIEQGGVFIWPILVTSLWAFTMLFERLFFFAKESKRLKKAAETYFRYAQNTSITEVQKQVNHKEGLIPEIIAAAWDPAHKGVSLAERAVEEVLHKYQPSLDRHLTTIATIAGLQPLLGLLGTITGMIATFSVISSEGTGDAAALADGISEAMITTQAGLCAAVPILLAHNFLRNRFKTLMAQLQGTCARALKEMEHHVAE